MNDYLIKNIAAYATPGVALTLLTSFVPLSAYGDGMWRTKANVESRGLMVDDAVLGRGEWYAYYLILNKTFCGDLLEIQSTNDDGDVITRTFHRNVIYYGEYVEGSIIQHSNLEIEVNSHTIHFNRVLRSAMHQYSPSERLYLLDEYGDLWLYCFGNNKLALLRGGEGILAIDADDYGESIILINRQGQAIFARTNKTISPLKLVSIQYTGSAFTAITSRGNKITLDVDARADASDYNRYLHDNITTHFQDAYHPYRENVLIVTYKEGVMYMTTDRTLHLNIPNERSPSGCIEDVVVGSAKHRTQMLAAVKFEYTRRMYYVIVDAESSGSAPLAATPTTRKLVCVNDSVYL